MSMRARSRRWLVELTAFVAADALASRRGASQALGAAAGRLGVAAGRLDGACGALERALITLEDRREAGRPFSGDTTVHRAWARHPGVRGVFVRYHLHACPDCAVGADETLAEAALGYRIPLEELLERLNALT